MKTQYYIDTKVTTWERQYFTVEEDTEEDNLKLAIKFFNREEELEIDNYEILGDATAEMTLEENEGYSTRELYKRDDYKLILENGINILK